MMAEMRGVCQHEPTILAPTGRRNKYCPTFLFPANGPHTLVHDHDHDDDDHYDKNNIDANWAQQ